MENTQKTIKRLGFFHSKDLDGSFSGAVLKHKYPDIELRGWDYKDEVPSFEEMEGFDEIILIDITFPLETLMKLGVRTKLTVIDHHISFKKQVDQWKGLKVENGVETVTYGNVTFEYIFDQNLSACELGMKHYFGYIPTIVELVGKYDTWRANGTSEWESLVLPMKYFLYGCVSKPEDVRKEWLDNMESDSTIGYMLDVGTSIMSYERTMDESKAKSYSFEREVFGGLKALCYNVHAFNSEMLRSVFDPEKHDIMIGFGYTGTNWICSLRSIKGGTNVSLIARERGGGGHVCAAGYQVEKFEDIFK